jgi:lysophospholipase L1-like esterase
VKSEVRNQKPHHKVLIIGDSYLKGSAVNTNQFLNTNFSVTSLIKPGATVSELVSSQGKDLTELGKNDMIVLSGGANDMDGTHETKGSDVVAKITQFVQTYYNTNIVILALPHRFDLHKESETNFGIQKINAELKEMTKLFRYASMIEMELNRDYHTKHGLHFNKAGKEKLARLTANLINQTVLSKKNENLEPIPNGKEVAKTATPILKTAMKKPSTTMDNLPSNDIVKEIRGKNLCPTMGIPTSSEMVNEVRGKGLCATIDNSLSSETVNETRGKKLDIIVNNLPSSEIANEGRGVKASTEDGLQTKVDNRQHNSYQSTRRISSRNKKAVTRNADFLWEDLTSPTLQVKIT